VGLVQEGAERLQVARREGCFSGVDAGGFAQHMARYPADREFECRVELGVGQRDQPRHVDPGGPCCVSRRGLLGQLVNQDVHDLYARHVRQEWRIFLDLEAEVVR
jgi:hypothetical protein